MIELYAADMLRTAGKVLPRREDAEDAVQDACLKLYRIRQSLPQAENLRALFLCRTAARCAAIDCIRRRRREIPEETKLLDQLASPSPGGTVSLPEGGFLGSLIRQMSPLRREIFILRYDDELKPAEIADILNISVLSVYQHLYRGKQWLKEQLDQTGCRIR